MVGAGAGWAWAQICCPTSCNITRARIRTINTSFPPRCDVTCRERGVVASGLEERRGVAGRGHKAWFWVGIGALVVAVVAAATFEILLHRAEPILRARLLQSLSARFHSRVELGEFDVSLFRGFEVSGRELAIYPY